MENIDKIYDLLNNIKVTKENKAYINEIKDLIATGDYLEAVKKMRELKDKETKIKAKAKVKHDDVKVIEVEEKINDESYPKQLINKDLEEIYIGLLLQNPKLISKYYFIFEICMFNDPEMLNIYKSILYNEGAKYSSELAKNKFNFSRDTEKVYELKNKLVKNVEKKHYDIEEIYRKLKKIF